MVSLKVNIHKKDLWLLSAIVVFLVGVAYVIAYGSSPANPAVFGHTANEVEGVNNAWVKFNGSASVSGSRILGSKGVSSVTHDGAGMYNITWETPFASSNYLVIVDPGYIDEGSTQSVTPNNVVVWVHNNGGASGGTWADTDIVYVMASE
ncbi:MAG: hypothetical protein PHH54_04895 [Candidatus Nanoarchaeia archaeon]|nr:hypothetical protein [Candidatus Nanoarchaeia archaeon]MDD5741295.1 hypothetical protein [Candidatus Nanoarchaeia archaeon]